MKRVLVLEFITTLGGVQSVYKNILPEIAKENEVFFLNPYSAEDDLGIGQYENIELVSVPLDSPKALGWKQGLLHKLMVVGKYGFRYLSYFFKLGAFVRQKKIDLLYVSGKKEFTFALLLKWFCGIPYIYHAHGFGKVADINWLTKSAIRQAEYVICVSNDVKAKIQSSGIDKNTVVVINNGLHLSTAEEKLCQAHVQPKDETNFTVVFAGTVQRQKGVHTLVQAIACLKEKGCNIKLNIVGQCNDAQYVEELQAAAPKDAVSFCGFSANIYDYFAAADLVVLPSYEESFGMVLLEAMYAKKPVIGSRIGGIPDIIVEEHNGYLFTCGDAADLAEKMLRLYDDRQLCRVFGENGFQRVCTVFSSHKQSEQINALIRERKSK